MAKEMRMNIYDDEDEDKLAQYRAELSAGEGGGGGWLLETVEQIINATVLTTTL